MNHSKYNEYVKQQTYNQSRGYVTQTKVVSVDKSVDNVYLNVVIDHPDYKGVTGATGINYPTEIVVDETPIEGVYNVTKTDPILDRCSDYYCSVVRFTIPLDQLPIAICPIIPNQSDPNLTPLIIGIEYGNTGPVNRFPVNVEYINENLEFGNTGPAQTFLTQYITPYYFIYAYQNLINMFNVALATAWVNSGLATAFPNYFPPYFFLTSATNLITLIVPSCFMQIVSPATSVPKIFMNVALGTYLDAFNGTNNGYNNPQGNDIYFLLANNNTPDHFYYPGGVAIPTATNPGTTGPAMPFYYQFTQEYSVLEYWGSLRKILITTNALPVRNEFLPSTTYTNAIQNVDSNGINVSYPILSDFVPNIDTSAGSGRSIAYYLPTAQYRLIDLLSDTPLQTIDIRLYWQDKDGNIYPLGISLFQQASLKILFTRKSLYKNDQQLIA